MFAFTLPKIIGFVIIVIGVILLLAGCQNQAAVLQPQIVAGDAAVSSGGILYSTGVLNITQLKQLSKDCHIADAGFKAALAAIDANQAPSAVVLSEVLASLDALALDLQTTPQAKALAAEIKKKVTLYRATPGGTKALTASEVITLIDLVIQLTPGVIADLNTLFSGVPITAADCHTALTKFEADLAAMDALIPVIAGQ